MMCGVVSLLLNSSAYHMLGPRLEMSWLANCSSSFLCLEELYPKSMCWHFESCSGWISDIACSEYTAMWSASLAVVPDFIDTSGMSAPDQCGMQSDTFQLAEVCPNATAADVSNAKPCTYAFTTPGAPLSHCANPQQQLCNCTALLTAVKGAHVMSWYTPVRLYGKILIWCAHPVLHMPVLHDKCTNAAMKVNCKQLMSTNRWCPLAMPSGLSFLFSLRNVAGQKHDSIQMLCSL